MILSRVFSVLFPGKKTHSTPRKKRNRNKDSRNEVTLDSPNIIHVKTVTRNPQGRIFCEDDSVTLTYDDHMDFRNIAQAFEHEDRQVSKISYVVNAPLEAMFLDCRRRLAAEGYPSDIIFVFHGTSRKNITQIMKNGFKVGGVGGHPVTHGALYGSGIYTSKYGQVPARFSSDMCLVACMGLPGNPDTHSIVPKQRPDWVIFKHPEQLLPCYVVYFESGNKLGPLLLPKRDETIHEGEEIPEATVIPTEDPATKDADGKAVNVLFDEIRLPEDISTQTVRAVQKELKKILKSQMNSNIHERGWEMQMETFDVLTVWTFLLTRFNEKLTLTKDLKKRGYPGITLEVTFPDGYPMSPPFIRVVKPRLLRYMNGGGGHVTAGGGICMEILTTSKWDAQYTIEGLLQIVHMLLSSKDPPARLSKDHDRPYTMKEAKDAFHRVARAHNWE